MILAILMAILQALANATGITQCGTYQGQQVCASPPPPATGSQGGEGCRIFCDDVPNPEPMD